MLQSCSPTYFIKVILCCFASVMTSSTIQAQHEPTDTTLLGLHVNPKFEKQEKDYIRQWGIDFHLLGTSLHYAKKTKRDFYIGGEIGFLPDAFNWIIAAGERYTAKNTIWGKDKNSAGRNPIFQYYFLHFFLRKKWETPKGWFDLDAGLRLAGLVYNPPDEDSFYFPEIYGVYIKPTFGYRKFRYGVRLESGIVAFEENGEFVTMLSPFLRFYFQ